MKDLVSIITPSYNSVNFIEETINSVIAQTYQNWEMIIVDDCSKDNSVELIQEYINKDSRIKLIQLDINSGAAVARNRAIKEAKGRFIAFLDSDDLWVSEKLEKQIAFMIEKEVFLSYSAYKVMDEQGQQMGEFMPPNEVTYYDMLRTCSIGCLTAIYDVTIVGKIYMPEIKKRQDYGLWLKILRKGGTAKGLLLPLAMYRVHDNSISSNKIGAAKYQWKIYRECEKLGLIKSYYYFMQYAIFGLIKHNFDYNNN